MEPPRHINLFFIVLSVLIYCTHGLPAEDNATALEKLVNANNEFAMKLHRSLSENSFRNIFFSPTSLFFALGMLYVGAEGETAQELSDFLGFRDAGLSDEEVNDSFYKLLEDIFNSSQNFTLKTANAILVDNQLNLTSEYKQFMDFYKANVEEVDFRRNTNRVLQKINQLISNQTDGKIPQFLHGLDPSTIMMILNAVYFKGLWSIPFEKKDTSRERFYNYGGVEKSNRLVDMMHTSHKMLYTSSSDWEMVELPYKGDRVSMVIILPKQRNGIEGFFAVENSLTPDQIIKYRRKMRMSTVNLTLPKFKIDFSYNLNSNLRSLGLRSMFENGANFSRMVRNGPVRVSNVMQKALINVNEEGTVAAAATGVYLVPLSLSLPRVFKVDHPFFFAIMDKKTDLILFTGRIVRM